MAEAEAQEAAKAAAGSSLSKGVDSVQQEKIGKLLPMVRVAFPIPLLNIIGLLGTEIRS